MPKKPVKPEKKAEIGLTITPSDIEVTPDGNVKINQKDVADTLKKMIEATKAREAAGEMHPTAIRVSA